MEDYKVSDYGIFNDAISTTKSFTDKITSIQTDMNNCKSKLNDESVFMGPICDSCVQGFGTVDGEITSLVSNFGTISSYLNDTATAYINGDTEAMKKVLSISGGTLTVGSSSNVSTGDATKDDIYNRLADKGFNNAAICGILANMEHESGFDTTVVGDNGTSYGLCQWHNSRWENLNSFCSNNNLDPSTVEGQVEYLCWELENNYPGVYETLKNVPNTAQGAHDAAYKWTVDFEIPDDRYNRGEQRGNTASSSYWETYGV